jgi:cbb3-type cytochrome oxidase subunit 3
MAPLLLPNCKHINYKKCIFVSCLTIIFSAITMISYAQPGGGDICPPEDQCPLDTWVVAFVIIALIFTTLYLYRRQKNALTAI